METRQLRYSVLNFSHHYGDILVHISGISNGISKTSQNFASLILFEPRVSALEFSTGRLETVARHERRRHAETIHTQRNKLMQHRSRLKIIQIRSHKEVNE